jgi:RHS repeat-associated protein
MVSKYDALGRIIMSGKLTSSVSRSSLQSLADGSVTATFETFTNVTTNYGYTHVSYPDLTATGAKVLTVTYYDKYDVLSNTSVNPATSVFSIPSVAVDSLEQNPRGMPVAKLVNVLGTANYLFSMMIYNKEGKAVRTVAQHYQGGNISSTKYDAIENQFSFQGIVTQTIRKHYLTSSSIPQVTISSISIYDYANRPVLLKQQYDQPSGNGAPVNISKIEYNEIGQLVTKHLHNTATGMPASSGFLQHIDYRYNSRGWLNRINNSASMLDETYATQLDLFGENLDYDQLSNGIGGSAKYNGNISNIKWQVKWASNISLPQQYKGYVFTYDPINRLTNADYKALNSADNTSFNEAVTYDELGNILTLTRKNGASSTLNSLVYNYMNGTNRSHMLTSVSDATGTEAYNSNYTYDTNGNLITDSKKAISSPVLYNELNLPAQISITTGAKVLKYTYDATGRKLERLITLAGTTAEDRFYVDGIEYVANAIQLIHTPEGRATPNGVNGAYIFEYNIADHLGNVRAVFGDKNNNGVLTADEILQTTDYYAFGRQINYSQVLTPNPDNTYLYNGKELRKDLGEYDYGARFYDAVIGRWNVVDPLAENSRRWSPYTYALNNPFRFIDPDGMSVSFDAAGNATYTGEDAVNYAKGLKAYAKKENEKKDGMAIFISYPDKKADIPRNLGWLRWLSKKAGGNNQLPVGHAGIVIIDSKGNTSYFDFGRFNRPDLKGQTRGVDEGAVRSSKNYSSLSIPNWNFQKTNTENIQDILTKLHDSPILREDGRILGALATGLDYNAMKDYARMVESEGYIPFGGYSKGYDPCDGSYCAKFARGVGVAGGVDFSFDTFQGIGNIEDIEKTYNTKRVEIPTPNP